MIDVKDMIVSIRYRLADMQGAAFSDHEIMEALNECVSLLFSVLSGHFSTLAVIKAPIVLDGNGGEKILSGPLPSDFHSVRDVRDNDGGSLSAVTGPPFGMGEYRIYGSRIDARHSVVLLEYYRIPRRVKSLAEKLDVANALRLPLIGMTAALLGGSFADAQAMAVQTARNEAGRELGHFENVGPVQVWGGKA
jgi:hypothetical protein